jgi:hypothetical protein
MPFNPPASWWGCPVSTIRWSKEKGRWYELTRDPSNGQLSWKKIPSNSSRLSTDQQLQELNSELHTSSEWYNAQGR